MDYAKPGSGISHPDITGTKSSKEDFVFLIPQILTAVFFFQDFDQRFDQ
jgi:hypothetical protein